MDSKDDVSFPKDPIVIIGGGVAATTCLQTLCSLFDSKTKNYQDIKIISDQKYVKKVYGLRTSGRCMLSFKVSDVELHKILDKTPKGLNIEYIYSVVTKIDHNCKLVYFINCEKQEQYIKYGKLCICTGAVPKKLELNQFKELNSKIIVLRDTNTLADFQSKLARVKNLAIVGNGGISLEIVSRVAGCNKTWIIKDSAIGSQFFDAGAAKFLLDSYKVSSANLSQDFSSDSFFMEDDRVEKELLKYGSGLGPGWNNNRNLVGLNTETSIDNLNIIYEDEVKCMEYRESEQEVRVTTMKGFVLNCDLVVVAIGVKPNCTISGLEEILRSEDGGILIDSNMRTSIADIYAAGDVVSCSNWPRQDLWFQMRLWTQARQMGQYVATCIDAHLEQSDPSLSFNFELFTHVSLFLGHKIILIGRYNGQGIDDESIRGYEMIVRVNAPEDYIKLLLNRENRIVGAVLIGDTGLEETIENLICDRIDVSSYKEHLLDGTVDIEDYFD